MATNTTTIFQTQPLPFSRISQFTFYPPKTYPSNPDDIDSLLHVGDSTSGYKPNLIQGELSVNFLAGISCAKCNGILNQPILTQTYTICMGCYKYGAPIDMALNSSIQAFNMYCPLYKRGCSWSGAIKCVVQHLEKDCDFLYQKCGYVEMGLCLRSEVLPRCKLAEHYSSTHAVIERVFNEVRTLKEEMDTKIQENRMLLLENQFLKQSYNDGVIMIQLQDFDENICSTISSPIFQTHTPPNVESTYGYNLQVTILLNLDKSLSAVITVKDGHSDDILPWPMLVNYSATIFSFVSDSQNANYSLFCSQIPQQCREKGSREAFGWSPLTTHEDMCKRSLLKDKTVYLVFKITFL